MAYAVASDIQSEFKSIDFSDVNAKVTEAEVTEFIAQEEAFLNSMICKVYVIPVSGDATALSVLKKIVILLVTHRVKKIILVRHTDPKKQDQDLRYSERKHALEMIEKILSGDIKLNSPEVSSSYQVQSHINDDPSICPSFNKGIKEW